MVTIDPKVLFKEKEPIIEEKKQYRGITYVIALFRAMLQKVIIKVELTNEDRFKSIFYKIQHDIKTISKNTNDKVTLDKLSSNIDVLSKVMSQIKGGGGGGGGAMLANTVGELKVDKLDKVTFDNIEVFTTALEQLKEVVYLLKGLQSQNTPINNSFKSFNKEISSLNSDNKSYLSKILDQIKNLVLKEVKFPSIQRVTGDVSISSMPEIDGFKEINSTLKALSREISKPQITNTKEIEFLLRDLKDEIIKLPKGIRIPETKFPETIKVANFPIQKYPMPVTRIDINPLRGFGKSNNVIVGTTPTPLPTTVLAYRRSLIVFNNDASKILYIGGSDVTTSNGLPVLAQAYSPALDAGAKMIIYGIVASGSVDIRCFEVSNDSYGQASSA